MRKNKYKPTRSPAKRVRVEEEERRSERGIDFWRFRDKAKSVTTRAVPIGCGLLFLFLLNFILFVGYVPSDSMEPAIREGSLIFGVRVLGDLKPGDVAVFEHDGLLLVKRIAGVQGDTVYDADGHPMTVPDGCYFMLGDNEERSVDSRCWDEPFIPKKNILAVLPGV